MKDVSRWGRDHALVQGMFCACIFQDALCPGVIDEGTMISLT